MQNQPRTILRGERFVEHDARGVELCWRPLCLGNVLTAKWNMVPLANGDPKHLRAFDVLVQWFETSK